MRLRSTFLLAATLAGLVVLDAHGSAAGQSAGPAAAIPRLALVAHDVALVGERFLIFEP